MKDTLDQLTQFSVFHPARSSEKSKIRLLSLIQIELKKSGVESEIYRLPGKKSNLALLSSNIETKNSVYMTHFDTPRYSLVKNHVPKDASNLKKENLQAIIGSFLLFLIIAVPFLLSVSNIWGDQTFNYKDILMMVYMGMLLLYMYLFRDGFRRRNSIIRNASSIVTLVQFIKINPKSSFAFVDYGCEDEYGEHCFHETFKNKKSIYIDSVGYGHCRAIDYEYGIVIAPHSIPNSTTIDSKEVIKNIDSALTMLEKQ